MCIQNFVLNRTTALTDLSGEYDRSYNVGTDDYIWINQRDTSLTWRYRETTYENDITRNWVLQENGADRVACAPGYVETPLGCTTYVYASSDQSLSRQRLGDSETLFKLGTCESTSRPTSEPTGDPTPFPTRVDRQCEVENGVYIPLNTTTTSECDFGYVGSGNIGKCLENGQIEWTYDCFAISFSDLFNGFDDSLWSVYERDDVSGEAAIEWNGGTRFVPDSQALVSVFKSNERINWPIRVRANVEKRDDEWLLSLCS